MEPPAPMDAGLERALHAIEPVRARGGRIVFTNGCFDLLHSGHVRCLERARALGDAMVVGVNSDASVRRLKGPSRPLVDESDRLSVVAALRCVDHALLFDDDTPARLIERIRPDILVKGGDYQGTPIVGQALVESYGGRVAFIDLVPGKSTTSLLAAILERHGAPHSPERRAAEPRRETP